MCISSSDTSIEPRAVAVSYWLLAIGYWLLAIGYWLLAIGCWLLAPGTGYPAMEALRPPIS